MRRFLSLLLLLATYPLVLNAQADHSGPPIRMIGLQSAAEIIRDTDGIAHIKATNDHDLLFLQGYVHAQDRLFQMDVSRREASGTLAELVGPSALAQDVQLRTLGLRRAGQRSWQVISPRAQRMLQAYADGINAYVASHPLPPEYQALELSHFDPWTPIDSLAVVKLIAFGLSFELDLQPTIDLLSYQQAGQLLQFDGTKLFFDDLDRSAPFDPASTVPDASVPSGKAGKNQGKWNTVPKYLHATTLALARDYLRKTDDMPLFRKLREGQRTGASNEWAVSARFSDNNVPLTANDPHLSLGTPATWYPIHLDSGSLDVIGNGFPGTPLVTLGHNRFIAWGATNDLIDATDTFQEQVVPDGTSPSGLSTVYLGKLEHVIPIPEVFRTNNLDGVLDDVTVVPAGGAIPAATLIVPRRNNGPIISLDTTTGDGLSVQWTGFSGSRELDAILTWAEARNLNDFQHGLGWFNCPPQNFVYSDTRGNVAYFAGGDMPVREDLQAGTVNGVPPYFVRNGTGGNEWLPVIHPQPQQAIPYEVLPAQEMPHITNPPAGFFVNANNDPAGVTLDNDPLNQLRPGGGIYYLGYTFDAGFRAGRITQLIRHNLQHGSISFHDMQAMQADVTLLDAEFFVPYITQAFANAKRFGAPPQLAALATNPAIAEAVGRLSQWDFTTPSGLANGFDAGDVFGQLNYRSQHEIANSVAATLYSVWRGQFVIGTVDAVLQPYNLPLPQDQEALKALRYLLENFATNGGVGASGINFFNVPGVSAAADRRDIFILQAVANTLNLLSGSGFMDDFGGSTNQDDYRWGKLHRIVFAHLLGSPFSIPPAGGAFPQPLPNLPGIPTDGGFATVDAASHPVRAASVNGFMFSSGPSNRSVYEALPFGMHGVSALPGGINGVLGSPLYFNLLPGWLTNTAYEQLFRTSELQNETSSVTKFVPAK
jgi:penicillin amidase